MTKSTFEQNSSQFEHMIAMMPGHIYWKDRDGVYQGCNNLQAANLGLPSRQAIVGKTDFDLSPKEKAEAFWQVDQEIMRSGEEKEIEEVVANVDGSISTVLSKKVPLYDLKNKEVVGILGISVDITDKKEAEDKLNAVYQKLSFITAALGNVVRTPMHAINIAVDMLKKTQLSDEQMGYLKLIESAYQNLLPNLAYASDYAKLEAGLLQLYPHECEFIAFTDRLLTKINYGRAYSNADIYLELDHPSEYVVFVDSQHLYQVLSILLNSVLELTKDTFLLSVKKADTVLELGFYDASEVFSKEVIEAISSERIDYTAPTSEQILKLIYCRRVLRAMNGDLKFVAHDTHYRVVIELPLLRQGVLPYEADIKQLVIFDTNAARAKALSSYFSQKTTVLARAEQLEVHKFTKGACLLLDEDMLDSKHNKQLLEQYFSDEKVAVVVLINPANKANYKKYPFVQLVEKPVSPISVRKEVSVSMDGKKVVLVVEDDMICQLATRSLLESLGFVVKVVGSGEEAVDFDVTSVNCIFMDIGLPGINGLQTAKQIHKKYGEKTPPIIAVSGLTMDVDQDDIQESGYFEMFLMKPASYDEIKQAVTDILG